VHGSKLNEICHHQMRFMASSTSKIRLRPWLRPGPHWGSLQRSPKPPSWWGGGSLPPPQEPQPRSRPFGPRASTLWASIFGPSSSLAPQIPKPNFAHGRWEICRTNQNNGCYGPVTYLNAVTIIVVPHVHCENKVRFARAEQLWLLLV